MENITSKTGQQQIPRPQTTRKSVSYAHEETRIMEILPVPANESLDYSHDRLLEWYKSTLDTLNYFWKIWFEDYLSALRDRQTTRIRQGRSTPYLPRIGEIVLLGDKHVSRGQWPLAVITKLSHDRQQQVRSVTVRTSSGNVLQRSVNHLYPLEITPQSDSPQQTRSPPRRLQPHRKVKRTSSYK
ncbi:hypothetical protein OSTOST_16199 [Ostertagia ostertagi]